MKAKSEIIRAMIAVAFDHDPGPVELNLADCLDLYAEAVAQEASAMMDAPAVPEPVSDPEPDIETRPTPPGRGGRFKAETLQRLMDWRAVNGLGCYAVLAKKSGGALAESDLRDIAIGDKPVPMAKWKALSETLDKVEGK